MEINELIDLYESKGGFYCQIEEGVLGFGRMRFYNKTPKIRLKNISKTIQNFNV